MKLNCGLLWLLVVASAAEAQTLKFTAGQTVNANGSVTPVLSWCTEGSPASAGTTCAGTGGASACAASGDWSGAKAASGSETLPAITSVKSYALACNWPGQDRFTVSWTPPTQRDDGTTLTNLKGYTIYFSTSPTGIPQEIDVTSAGATSQLVGPGLVPGTYYVQIDAYDTAGIQSKKSPAAPLVKTLGAGVSVTQSFKVSFPNPPTGLTVN